MKHIFTLLLVLTLSFGLASCGGNTTQEDNTPNQQETTDTPEGEDTDDNTDEEDVQDEADEDTPQEDDTDEEDSEYLPYDFVDEVTFNDEEKGIHGVIQVAHTNEMHIFGEAVGNWFFEAEFLVEVVDEEYNQLALEPVTAQGEWMTTEPVIYDTGIAYETSDTDYGYVLFHPADMRDYDTPEEQAEAEQEKQVVVKVRLR